MAMQIPVQSQLRQISSLNRLLSQYDQIQYSYKVAKGKLDRLRSDIRTLMTTLNLRQHKHFWTYPTPTGIKGREITAELSPNRRFSHWDISSLREFIGDKLFFQIAEYTIDEEKLQETVGDRGLPIDPILKFKIYEDHPDKLLIK